MQTTEPLNILYLGYWPSGDALTEAVIYPKLETLSKIYRISKIVFCSIERNNSVPADIHIPKVVLASFHSIQKGNVYLTKIGDFFKLPNFLYDLISSHKLNLTICNSTLAGALGFKIWKKTDIPFIVECFEPHAAYMLESNIWHAWDPRYVTLRYYENRQKAKAAFLLPVSNHYTTKLIKEGVDPKKILTLPNGIDVDNFKLNESDRIMMRTQLDIRDDEFVGIYAGKFGGIYHYEHAFDLFVCAFKCIKNFKLIILSSTDHVEIKQNLVKRGIDVKKVFIGFVRRTQVPQYLSAADFAFAPIKPSPSRIYCCPIKNGEYWSNGLPVFMEDGIGDDSDIIKTEGGGVIYHSREIEKGFLQLSKILDAGRKDLSEKIVRLAYKYRNVELNKLVFEKIIERVVI
jgi:glycosyltransferase involved in cell wall biosynthesis